MSSSNTIEMMALRAGIRRIIAEEKTRKQRSRALRRHVADGLVALNAGDVTIDEFIAEVLNESALQIEQNKVEREVVAA